MIGKAVSFGAVSIVNAIASGKGATASIKLRTEAKVELKNEAGPWRITINGRNSNTTFPVEVVFATLRSLNMFPSEFSGTIETSSDIPIRMGLKSSSSSSVAISLAALAALGRKGFDPQRAMMSSVEASLSSGVSITGALDDAASCLIGGMNHTDNAKRLILKSKLFDRVYKVLIRLPEIKSKRQLASMEHVRKFSRLADAAFKMSMEGDSWNAMTLNGLIYSSILSYDPLPALRAIDLGALGAGLSGTGPSTAAIFEAREQDLVQKLKTEWMADGSRVIETETNNEQGRIIID